MRANELLSARMFDNGAVEAVVTQAQRQRAHEATFGDPFQQHMGPAMEALVRRSDWRGLPRQTKRDMAMSAVAGEELRRQAEREEFERAGVPRGKRSRQEDDVEAYADDDYEDGDYEDDPTLGNFDLAASLVERASLQNSETLADWLEELNAGEFEATPRQRQQLEEAFADALQDDEMLTQWSAEHQGVP